MISMVMGDGVTLVSSAEECAKDVYKLLARTGTMRPDGDADVPVPDHRLAGRVRGDRAPLPRARSWRWRRTSPAPWEASHEAHGRRLLRVPTPAPTRRPAATWSRPPTPRAAPGGWCSTWATAPSAPCTTTPTRWTSTPSRCPTCTPTTASTSPASTCCGATTPRARTRRSPCGVRRAPPSGMARAYDLPPSPGMTGEFDFRTYDGVVPARTVRGRADAGRPPGR